MSGIPVRINPLKATIFVSFAGTALSFLLDRKFWGDFHESSGQAMIAFFIAPFLAVLLGVLLHFFYRDHTWKNIIYPLLAFLLINIPLLHHFTDRFSYPEKNDSSLYSRAAEYMVQHGTFCSYDSRLVGVDIGNHYLFQPGYKYYLAAMMYLHDGDLTRGIQFWGAILIVLAVVSSLRSIRSAEPGLRLLFFVFLLGIVPALTKNMLMGLTEWLAVVLMLFALALKKRNLGISFVFLGLAVFVRQTFLPIALLAVLFTLLNRRRMEIPALFFFSLVLSLPLWHNIYYAGRVIYFADYSWWSVLSGMDQRSFFMHTMVIPYQWVFLQYLGVDVAYFKVINFVIGLMFIPVGWLLAVSITKQVWYSSKWQMAMIMGAMALLILPSLAYNGVAWFPRFQLFNFCSYFVLYLFCFSDQKASDLDELAASG